VTRSGIVTVAGKPNAGKSTLLNRLVGQKLAITSPKPQSTRDRVTGIVSTADTQLVLIDTPGLLDPRYALQRAMRATAMNALHDADVVVYVVDATDPGSPPLTEAAGLASPLRAPVVTALNKIDLLTPERRQDLVTSMAANAHLVSAVTGEGIDTMVKAVGALLPESPFLYDPDDASTQSLRFFVSELVRETALEQLEEEVPYAVACTIEEFREDRSPVYIRAVLYVERASQKRIVIGEGGSRIRDMGRAARLKVEALIGAPVYLDLWVKVLDNWRRDANALRRLGYHVPEDSGR
jgi:GTP-binding protein Era